MENRNISIWEAETFYRNRDIIIIGAGFTGLWTAIAIKEKHPEFSVLVVDKKAIPQGASSRNAGFACFGSLTEILADAEKMGWQKTLDLVTMRYNGLQKIQHYYNANEIDFELCGGYEILNNDGPLKKIDEVNERLKPITGIEKTFSLDQGKIEDFGLSGTRFLVKNVAEGFLHSGKLLMKLLEQCHEKNIEFLFGTEILEISENKNLVELKTNNGKLTTKKLIHCTNAFASIFFTDKDIVPARGQILLTEPIENLKMRGTFHYDEGFYYWRNLGNRILLGGARNQDFENEKTMSFNTTELLQTHLENFLKTVILPNQNPKIEMRWSGIMAMGSDKSPLVEKITDRQIIAVRLSGMGVALAPKIGELVAELISH